MTSYEEYDDARLVAACRDGDARAWDALVARYERLVYTIPIRYGLAQAEADDVFQTVWVTLLEHLPSLRQPDRIGAWLVTTARRACWDRRRGSEFERTFSVDPDEMPEPDAAWVSGDVEELLVRFERHEHVRTALRELGERCRSLLRYLYQDPEQPSYTEIAHRLDMAVGSIGPTRARCLRKLQEILGA